MEQQFLKLLKEQFPVDDDDDDYDTIEEEHKMHNELSQQLNFPDEADIVAIDFPINRVHSINQINNKFLEGQEEEEGMIGNLLSDSKDQLEDPNHQMHYFDLEINCEEEEKEKDKGRTIKNEAYTDQNIAEHPDIIIVETPAFGKKKNPTLFKGKPGTAREHQLLDMSGQTSKKKNSK